MIVLDQPSALRLFLVMQGSIVPRILHKILAVAGLSTAILMIDRMALPLPHVSISAIGVFGIALSLFLGFRNNAAYDRWWEARGLWGQLIAETRNLGRQVTLFSPDPALHARVMSNAVAFAHLHRGALRGEDTRAELLPWADDADALLAHANPADAALSRINAALAAAELDGYARMTLSGTLSAMGLAQAGGERIATTPLPFVYSLLVRRTTYLYCFLLPFALADQAGWFTPLLAAIVAYVFFGLQAVTRELEHPFQNVENGLPLHAMCRVIEISAAEALGRPAPPPVAPTDGVLT
ncbi:MAG: bestrophin family ion channel [Roseovarius sp.]